MQVRAGKLRLSDLDSDCIPGLLFGQDEGEESEVFTLDAKFKGKLKNSHRNPLPVAIQSLSRVRLLAAPRSVAHQASLSFTISWSSLKLKFIESMMPFNYLILCRPILLLPSIFPNIREF